MSSAEPQLLKSLTPQQRSTAEAILSRSEIDTLPAKTLETALALIHVQADQATANLLSVLARTVVFVLLKDPQDWKTLLILENESGDYYLGAFSSEAQAETARQDYGMFYQITAIDVALLCHSLSGALGLALNPHDDVLSFEISPEIFTHFRKSQAERGEPIQGSYYSVLAGQSGYHAIRVDSVTPTLIKLTWIETGWPMRPHRIDSNALAKHPSVPCEASPKAFQKWLPLASV